LSRSTRRVELENRRSQRNSRKPQEERPVIHTDDFASADNPINWWPRMLAQVIEPLARGDAAVYQRYDWPSESLADRCRLDGVPFERRLSPTIVAQGNGEVVLPPD
jgi:hypothetical protein